MTNEPDQVLRKLRHSFLPATEFARLRRELLEIRPIMRPDQFATGYNAVNINFDTAGAAHCAWCAPNLKLILKVLLLQNFCSIAVLMLRYIA